MTKRRVKASQIAPKLHLPTVSAKTTNQKDYVRSICENTVTVCLGPAGTGKSMLSIGLACDHLLHGKIQNIVVSRPFVASGVGLGFLPGTLLEKMLPHLLSIEEYFQYFLGPLYQSYKDRGQIKILPLEYMRGATHNNSYMLLEEAQNTSLDQIKMFLSRMGNDSKCIISGDTKQTDLHGKSGLYTAAEKLDGLHDVGIIHMGRQDIMRNGLIADILDRLDN